MTVLGIIFYTAMVLFFIGCIPGLWTDGLIAAKVTGLPYRWKYRTRASRRKVLRAYIKAAREGGDPSNLYDAYKTQVGCLHLHDPRDWIFEIFDAHAEGKGWPSNWRSR